jgi:hypothetical protein
VLGAQISPYLQRGEWQFGANYRQFTADTQYQRTDLSQPVTQYGTQVISKTNAVDFSGIYAATPQWNLSLTVPLFVLASSNRALPASVSGSPRYIHTATGFGDILIGAHYWLMDCDSHRDQNISLGISLKVPSGDSSATDLFPNALGQDIRTRVVDQSIQPGDGGWGFTLSVDAFKQFGRLTVFGNGVYLFNPRGRNDTISPPSFLNPNGPTAVDERIRFNSVSDSYLFRAGVGYPIGIPGVALSFAGRIDGVPVHDVFGPSPGFRRPGYFAAVEPGINVGKGNAVFALSVPLRIHQNVKDDTFGLKRDSTIADHILIMSLTYRVGGE